MSNDYLIGTAILGATDTPAAPSPKPDDVPGWYRQLVQTAHLEMWQGHMVTILLGTLTIIWIGAFSEGGKKLTNWLFPPKV